MRAALYARVSTDKQAEKYGIPSQIEALRRRCLERGWNIVPDTDREAFVDDGFSGSELNRPALNRLIDYLLAAQPISSASSVSGVGTPLASQPIRL